MGRDTLHYNKSNMIQSIFDTISENIIFPSLLYLNFSLSMLLNGHKSYYLNNFYLFKFLSSSLYRLITQILSNTELLHPSCHSPWNYSAHIKELTFNSYKITFLPENPHCFTKVVVFKNSRKMLIEVPEMLATWQ